MAPLQDFNIFFLVCRNSDPRSRHIIQIFYFVWIIGIWMPNWRNNVSTHISLTIEKWNRGYNNDYWYNYRYAPAAVRMILFLGILMYNILYLYWIKTNFINNNHQDNK